MARVAIAGKEDLKKSVSYVDKVNLSVEGNTLNMQVGNSAGYPSAKAATILPLASGGSSNVTKIHTNPVPTEGLVLYPKHSGNTFFVTERFFAIDLLPDPVTGEEWESGDYVEIVASYPYLDDAQVTLTKGNNKVRLVCERPGRFLVLDEMSERNSGWTGPSIQVITTPDPISKFSGELTYNVVPLPSVNLTEGISSDTVCVEFKPVNDVNAIWTKENPLREVYASIANCSEKELAKRVVTYLFYGDTGAGTEEYISGVTVDYGEVLSKMSKNIPKPLFSLDTADKTADDAYLEIGVEGADTNKSIGVTRIVAFIHDNTDVSLLKNLQFSLSAAYPNGSLPFTNASRYGLDPEWLPEWSRYYNGPFNWLFEFAYEKFNPTTLEYELGLQDKADVASFFTKSIISGATKQLYVNVEGDSSAFLDYKQLSKRTSVLTLSEQVKRSLYLIACDANDKFLAAIPAQYVEDLQGWWIYIGNRFHGLEVKGYRLALVNVKSSDVGNRNFADDNKSRAATKLLSDLISSAEPCTAFKGNTPPLICMDSDGENYYESVSILEEREEDDEE